MYKKMNSESKSLFKPSGKFAVFLVMFIFSIVLLTMTLYEKLHQHKNTEDTTVIKFVMNTLRQHYNSSDSELPETERVVRAVADEWKITQPTEPTPTTNKTNQNYYEEQMPVVVHAETQPAVAYRQSAFGPPVKTDSNEEAPYYAADADYSNEQASNEQNYYQRQPNAYYDDSRENIDEDAENDQQYAQPYSSDEVRDHESEEQQPLVEDTYVPAAYNRGQYYDSGEGRGVQDRGYDSYYRQMLYGTPAPRNDNRKLQTMQAFNKNRESYVVREEERQPWKYQSNRYKAQQNSNQYRQPQSRPQQMSSLMSKSNSIAAASSNALQPTPPPQQENTLVSVLKSMKTVWDIYQALSSAWNAVAEHRRQQEIQLRQQQLKKQQQLRINSKKPAKFDGDKFNQQNNNNNNNTTTEKSIRKATKTPKTTKTTTTTNTPTAAETTRKTKTRTTAKSVELSAAKVEPRHGNLKGDNDKELNGMGVREKRQSIMMNDNARDTTTNDVAEGRYIKGDPLKGYYDFVITEGSYKFWAAFQVGTALLIIYSTFAAIYYSKVNPLVSDYDYTDYLGGGRAMSGGDLDFVDDGDGEANVESDSQTKHWYDAIPRPGHSLKFILDAIDKLPVDHETKQVKVKRNLYENDNASTFEEADDDFE